MATKVKSHGVDTDDFCMENGSRPTMPYLSAAYQDRIRPCIDLVDSLRRIGLDRDVDLPAVVVIGDQSVGKSSVLEAISGVQLPRGTEIVTRCPVELRLKTLDENDWRGRIRYTSYSRETVDKYIDHPDNVGAEIRDAQNKITNTQKGISENLITVEIESPHVPNLTLIDLPGIARVALDGQPDNIAEKIKALLKKFIAKEETIILCVIPCNVDIATTEALNLAQEVDPTGARTLGVLTKPDLVDVGAEPIVVKIAQNKVIPLKKGYTIIKCRGQRNVESKQSLDDAMDEEERFFKEHKIYNVLYHERCAGTRVLANRLTTELVEQIRKSVPQLQRGIKDKLEETKQELTALGETVPVDSVQRIDLLVRILGRFPEDFQNAADGVYKNATWDRSLRLQTIVKKLYEKFADELEALQPKPQTVTDTGTIQNPLKARGSPSKNQKRDQENPPETKTKLKIQNTAKSPETLQSKDACPSKSKTANEQIIHETPSVKSYNPPASSQPAHMLAKPGQTMPILRGGDISQDIRKPGNVTASKEKSASRPILPRPESSKSATLPPSLPDNRGLFSTKNRSATLPTAPDDWDLLEDDGCGSGIQDVPSYAYVAKQRKKNRSKFFGSRRPKERETKGGAEVAPRRDFPDARERTKHSDAKPAQTRFDVASAGQKPQNVARFRDEVSRTEFQTTPYSPLQGAAIPEQRKESRHDSESDEEQYYSPDELVGGGKQTTLAQVHVPQSPDHLRPLESVRDGHVASQQQTLDADSESVTSEDTVVSSTRDELDSMKADEQITLLPEGDSHLPEIKEEIREQKGLELPPFVKDRVICENLIRRIIKEFIPPAERLLQAVNFEVERVGQKLVMDTYLQFPRLQTTVMGKFCDLQQQAVQLTKEAIDVKFKMEDMIQTQDRIYRDVEKQMLQAPTSGASSSSSEPPGGSGNSPGESDEIPYTYDEESEARKILRALQVYLKVATNRLMDDIPMTITYYLLRELAKEIKTEMAKFMIQKDFDEFLREDPAIEERRLALENKKERLDRANKELALFTL